MEMSLASVAKKVAALGMGHDKTVFMLSASLTKEKHLSCFSYQTMTVLFSFCLSRKMSYKGVKSELTVLRNGFVIKIYFFAKSH